MTAAIRAHPLTAFFVLAYAFSWSLWPIHAVDPGTGPILPFGPFLAGVVVLAATRGRPGVRTLLRSMIAWRVPVRWWAAALLIPAAVTITAAGFNIALGSPTPSAAELAGWANILPTALLILLVPVFGGAWEEPGWRGYALPGLVARRSPVGASLVLGALWAGWHLPMFLAGRIHWSDSVSMLASSVVFTWLILGAGGSVLTAMAFHAVNNAVSGEFVSPMFSGADSVRQGWMLVLVWSLAALVVTIATPRMRVTANLPRRARTAQPPAGRVVVSYSRQLEGGESG